MMENVGERKGLTKSGIKRDSRASNEEVVRISKMGRLYGDSLYNLATEEHVEDKMAEQVVELGDIFRENPDYLALLKEPVLPVKERLQLIDQAFGKEFESYLLHLLKILCERNLLGELSGCLEEFRIRYKKDKGVVEGIVTSAFPISEKQMGELEEKFSRIRGKRVLLIQKQDEEVLAGIRISLDGKVYDGTVARRLAELAGQLEKTIL